MRPVSLLWRFPPRDMHKKLKSLIDSIQRQKDTEINGYVFFRADDIAAPGQRLTRLMKLFLHYQAPLSIAVVPGRLTPLQWKHISAVHHPKAPLWCWHQHGWLHKNHESKGKKQEFGASRSYLQLETDLVRGRRRLEHIVGDDFFPAFTPPWNRCGNDTLEILKASGYRAISRSKGSRPPTVIGLPDFQVNVDLHTRKETDSGQSWINLFRELEGALLSELCGIMIHHQRMNDAAFDFLEDLIQTFAQYKRVHLVDLKKLAALKAAVHLAPPLG